MEGVQELFSGSGAFALSFLASLGLLAVFITLYSFVTAHREIDALRDEMRRGRVQLALVVGEFGALVPGQ